LVELAALLPAHHLLTSRPPPIRWEAGGNKHVHGLTTCAAVTTRFMSHATLQGLKRSTEVHNRRGHHGG